MLYCINLYYTLYSLIALNLDNHDSINKSNCDVPTSCSSNVIFYLSNSKTVCMYLYHSLRRDPHKNDYLFLVPLYNINKIL